METNHKKESSERKKYGSSHSRTQQQSKQAREDTKKIVDAAEKKQALVVFCDGACKGNPGPATAAAILYYYTKQGTSENKSSSGVEQVTKIKKESIITASLGQATNNIAELMAVWLALDVMASEYKSFQGPIEIFTDSQYTINMLSKNFKAKSNVCLIEKLKHRLAQIVKNGNAVSFHFVGGHCQIPQNVAVDKLAQEAFFSDQIFDISAIINEPLVDDDQE